MRERFIHFVYKADDPKMIIQKIFRNHGSAIRYMSSYDEKMCSRGFNLDVVEDEIKTKVEYLKIGDEFPKELKYL